ncbi:MAG: right-handed parallel beta-helix repeat-containing protein [Candidatus Poseidoniales archaeon]|nr:right-handed parallel beta-helix repeat-containing protein [Candidatus Poseidoniales archaeon]
MVRSKTVSAIVILSIFLISIQSPILLSESENSLTNGRSQTTWSGNIVLNNHHTIPVTDELVITACTNVTMSNGVRIYVEGRITVEGTSNCPVYFDFAGGGDHMGIQFNSSSNGRNSRIDNASIVHSTYGITIYGSDPYLANVTIWNPDDVGIDMFNSATPTIRDLVIDEAGQDWNFPSYWRYGIGISIGAGSAPNIDGLTITDAVTRGVNMWGNSGGLIRNLSVVNITGATLAQAAGIWVEDSVPLIEYAAVDKSDHGAIIRHMDDGSITRAVIRDLDITNSMYKAIILDKDDRTNYTNYQSAIIEGLNISGTGGPDAKTPGLATAVIEINATGAWIENAFLDDNDAVGVQLYFVDSSTVFSNLTINNTGGTGTGANAAGVSIRSSYFAAKFDNLEISNSTGPGVFALNGGAIQGSDWSLHDNGQEGFYLESAATIVDGLTLENNGNSGVHIDDARYVYLSNLSSSGNADAGLEFNRANDIESGSGDVSCISCVSIGDNRGVSITDSVDIHFQDLEIHDPLTGPAISIDNSGLNIGVQGGMFHLHDVTTWINYSGPAIDISGAEGEIDGLDMYGDHHGIVWDADHNVERNSVLSNANLSGSGCLNLSNHDQLSGYGNTIKIDCTGELNFVNVEINWSQFSDEGAHVLNVDTDSHLHLHQPSNINYAGSVIDGNGWIEESWDILVWAINNNSNGIPNAGITLGFDQLESTISNSTNDVGWITFPDLRGKKYFSVGQSPYTQVTVDCSYSGVTNSTNISLNQDTIVWCHLPLQNQAPFIGWDSPSDQMIFPSQGEVHFNASSSWDLDDDLLLFSWSSSIDGSLLQGSDIAHSDFIANSDQPGPHTVNLSDGIHIITLSVCDEAHCSTEQRTIELVNLPPIVVVSTDPPLSPWGELINPITKPVEFSLNGTFDPEGDDLTCSWNWLNYSQSISDCTNGTGTISFANMSITEFNLELLVDDGVNEPREWIIPVELYNEMPSASFDVLREGNLSENEITLSSTSVDPEGDEITYLWESSLDGIISNQSTWMGHLSRGNHVITLSVNDGRMEHINSTSINSTILNVENSPPKAVIHTPITGENYDSSHRFEFNASGSGDWDSACYTFPNDIAWHCSPTEPASGSEYLIYTWESDLDGILQENDSDWLIFEGHLTSGTHTITLTMDDGVNLPVTTSIVIQINPSAPVLKMLSPDLSQGYHSSDLIEFDITQSVDYDGDEFTASMSSNIDGDLLIDENPFEIHGIHLSAGEHQISFNLTDETGLSRIEMVNLTVIESDPEAVVYEPLNNQFYEPGELVILDSNGTNDADNDITRREWRHHVPGELYPIVLSNDAYYSTNLLPGVHHISLFVEDRRGGVDEAHLNITIASSSPDLSNLTATPKVITVDELTKVKVRVELDDPDGTTSQINATITKNLQVWTFNLTDDNGDGVWEGDIEIMPGESGKAQLKVTALDGQNIDYMSINIDFVEEENDNTSLFITVGAVGGFLLMSGMVVLLLMRRRKRLADIDLIDSWGVFGGESKEYLDEELEL